MRTSSALWYSLIGALILIVLGLIGWYFFITARQATVEEEAAARGAGLSAQTFGSDLGSTYENIVSNISAVVTESVSEDAREIPRLARVTKTPVAGLGFVAGATSTLLRFVERSSGFVFDADPRTLSLDRLTNTLVSTTYEALVAKSGRLILRGVDDNGSITTFTAEVTSTSTAEGLHALTLARLPNDLASIAIAPSGEEFFYIGEGAGGGIGVHSTWDTSKQTPLFSSAIVGWRAYWLPSGRIVVGQNAASGLVGYAYGVQDGGVLSGIVYDVPGLTILPHPTSSALLYGSSSGSGLALFSRIESSASVTALPIRTIADKCVWSPVERAVAFCAVPQTQPAGDFLDAWYRGEVHTSDAWWRVDAQAATAELVFSPPNATIDVENPVIDSSGTYIAFMNAIDKSLWILRTTE